MTFSESTPPNSTPLSSREPSPTALTPTALVSTDGHASDEHHTSDSSASTSEDDEALTESLTRSTSVPAARRPLYNHTSRSYTTLPPSSSQLFPPFYNRPPTPLPPSPSLTSLLRPNFSRPTTPDTSDAESAASTTGPGGGGGGSVAGSSTTTPALAVAKSALKAPRTILPATPKIPTYEYYGFALYLASTFAFGMYLLWAYLPRPFLHQLGIYYYPNRWWALAMPAWLVVLVGYIFVALASWNTGVLTLPMGGLGAMVDEVGHVAVVDGEGRIIRKRPAGRGGRGKERRTGGGAGGKGSVRGKRGEDGMKDKGMQPANLLGRDLDWRTLWNEGTDAVMDIPIGGVCEILYGIGREDLRLSGEEDDDDDEDEDDDDGALVIKGG